MFYTLTVKEMINKKISGILTKNDFYCSENVCENKLAQLSGTIYQKNSNQDNTKINKFQKPIAVNFYKYKEHTSLLKAASVVLYPIAIVADIVSAPIQLVMVVQGLGHISAH